MTCDPSKVGIMSVVEAVLSAAAAELVLDADIAEGCDRQVRSQAAVLTQVRPLESRGGGAKSRPGRGTAPTDAGPRERRRGDAHTNII